MEDLKLRSLGYNPGKFKLSKRKLKQIIEIMNYNQEDVKKIKKNLKGIKTTLKSGDMQMAKVISLNPFVIAIYTDEFDAVLMLKFPEKLLNYYFDLKENTRLVSVNSYWPKEAFSIENDIIPGKNCSNDWRDVIPFIPLFLTDEEAKCEGYPNIFPIEHWEYFDQLINEYLNQKPNQYRDGFKTLVNYWR